MACSPRDTRPAAADVARPTDDLAIWAAPRLTTCPAADPATRVAAARTA